MESLSGEFDEEIAEALKQEKLERLKKKRERREEKKNSNVDLTSYMPPVERPTLTNGNDDSSPSNKRQRVDSKEIDVERKAADNKPRVVDKERKPAPVKRNTRPIDDIPVSKELVTSGKDWKEVSSTVKLCVVSSNVFQTGLHPSWAARKISQSAGVTAFAGKKIVFDDSDS